MKTGPRFPCKTRILRPALLAMLVLLWRSGGGAQEIRDFPATQPQGIAPGPGGAIWFAEGSAGRIGRIDGNGVVTEFQVGHAVSSIARGSDGNIWFTSDAGIGQMTPSGVLTWHPVSNAFQIMSGPDGSLWYSTWRRDGAASIGRITTTGAITEFPLSPGSPTYLPEWDPCPDVYVIAGGPDGNIWYTRPCSGKLGRITTSGTVTEFGLPTANSRPTRIAAGPDGNLWFTETLERVGRMTPNGDVTEFPLSGGAQAIIGGFDGNLWAAGPGMLSRITTSGEVTQFPVPINTDAPGIAAASDGAIWIADSESGRIVRFAPALDTTSCAASATTLCLDKGRFRVTADWTAGDGSTGHGHGVNLTANSGYFWFFDPANVELVVKVLDGCSANQHHWAFAAGLTNVEVTTTVTDTYSGVARMYTNPQSTPFAPIQDTAAFGTCP